MRAKSHINRDVRRCSVNRALDNAAIEIEAKMFFLAWSKVKTPLDNQTHYFINIEVAKEFRR